MILKSFDRVCLCTVDSSRSGLFREQGWWEPAVCGVLNFAPGAACEKQDVSAALRHSCYQHRVAVFRLQFEWYRGNNIPSHCIFTKRRNFIF